VPLSVRSQKGRLPRRQVGARGDARKGADRDEAVAGVALAPIITMNATGVIQSASDSVERLFGWTPAELLGRNVKLLIPEPRRSALDLYLDRYRSSDHARATYRTSQFDAQRKDGSSLRIELTMSRADLPAQAPPYFIGIIRDVSRRIEVLTGNGAEKSRLQRLVTEQTRALASAHLRLHLADRLASLGTLAAGLGHDLNNVLLPVRARLNAIEHAGLAPAALRHLTAVRRSIAYLQHLSDGFHFLAIDPDAEGVSDDGLTDLVQWWDQVGALLRQALPPRVELKCTIPKSLPLVRIAAHWLTQAMLNLIINAGESIDLRRKGRVKIWAKPSDDGSMVSVAVTDNGRGMARAVQRRAFDLFFTTKSRSMGTGLGLPMARKVAQRAGGEVALRSEIGHGTTAIITLMSEGRGNTDDTAPRQSPHPLAIVTIENARTAALASQVLIAAGFEIGSGRSADPGLASVWVTDGAPRTLQPARRWRKSLPSGAIVLCGRPPLRTNAAWGALNPIIIDPPDDFEAILHVLRGVTRGIRRSTNTDTKGESHVPDAVPPQSRRTAPIASPRQPRRPGPIRPQRTRRKRA